MDYAERFLELWDMVFDADNQVRTCGRENCKELIETAMRLDTKNFGDRKTGMMRVPELRDLHERLSR